MGVLWLIFFHAWDFSLIFSRKYTFPLHFKLVWQYSIINYLMRSFGEKCNEIAKPKQNEIRKNRKQTTVAFKTHTSTTTFTGTHISCLTSVTVFPWASNPHYYANDRACSVPVLMLDSRGSRGFPLSWGPRWKTPGSWNPKLSWLHQCQ